MNEQKFHEECDIVSRVKSMPDGEKQKGGNVTDIFVIQEL